MTQSHNHSPLVIRILQDFRQALLAREDAQLTRMAREWLRIEASLQDDMYVLAQQIEYAKEHGAAVTEQLIAKQEKYQVLEAQLQEQILRYAKNVAVPDISREQVAYAEHGVKGAVDAIKASYINMVPTFNLLSVDALTDYIGMLGDGTPLYRLLKEAYPDALDGVVKSLLNGMARGLGPQQTAVEMSKGMGLGLERISLIARTEQLRVWRVATAKQYQESGVVVESRRLCMKDERTCMACLMSDGETIPIDKVLHDHPRGRAEVSGSMILSSSPTALITHNYNGDIIVIHAASGNFLTVTPTHPVLTRRGWIAAKFIREGDDVVSDGRTDRTSKIVGPNEDYVPTRVEKIAGSFDMFSLGCVPESAKHLYRDGGKDDGEVDVIFINRLLWDSFDSSFQEQLREFYFGRRSVRPSLFNSLRSFEQVLFACLSSFVSINPMLQFDPLLLNAHSNVPELISVRGSESFNVSIEEDLPDWPSGDIERFSNGIFRFTSGVPSNNIGGVDSVFGTPEQPLSLEQVRQSLRTGMPDAGRFGDVITSQIRFDSVTHIDVRRFSGHVYSLQTKEKWYSSNGIISHNCTSVPIVRNAPKVTWELGKTWFLKQPATVQEEMMGKGMYKLWQETNFNLSDLAGIAESKVWGDSPRVKTLEEMQNA